MWNPFRKRTKNRSFSSTVEFAEPSLKEGMAKFQLFAHEINPGYPIELLDVFSKAAMIIPDFSQAISKMTQLGNTGHTVSFEGLSKQQEQKAKEEIDLLSKDLFGRVSGTDGLVNAMFRQVLTKGAISVEWVPEMNLSGIRKVVQVPVRQIRFRKDEKGELIVYQDFYGERIDLNPETYQYLPLFQEEASPYGIPPFIAALAAALASKDGMENIRSFLKKMGLLGLVNVSKKQPMRDYNKSEREWEEYLATRLRKTADSFKKNFLSGVAVHYDDVSIQHTQLNSNAQGASELWRMMEEQIASGIDIDPALLGRSYSTTETYAGVVYSAFLSQLHNIRRLIKRSLERGFYLHLVMKGYPLNRVKVNFNKDRGLNPQSDAQADDFRVRTVLAKINAGIIDRDQGARELGYEKATGTPQNQNQNQGLESPEKKSVGPFGGSERAKVIPFRSIA